MCSGEAQSTGGVGSAARRWNEDLSVGNVRVGMRVKEVATTTVSLRYFHTNHLNSISVITNESGAVVERLSYDTWANTAIRTARTIRQGASPARPAAASPATRNWIRLGSST